MTTTIIDELRARIEEFPFDSDQRKRAMVNLDTLTEEEARQALAGLNALRRQGNLLRQRLGLLGSNPTPAS